MVGLLLELQDLGGAMPRIYNTIDVHDYWPNERTPCWRIVYERPDGALHCTVMPKLTLEARSIEYGIDREDTEALWDIATHEPWMVHPYDLASVAKAGGDPAVPLGLVVPSPRGYETIAPGDPIGVTCHTAETIADGRAAHLARLEHCKSELVVTQDKKALRRPCLKHREGDWTQAHIEDTFRTARKFERIKVAEARRVAEKR
jgi:hypothetical protein